MCTEYIGSNRILAPVKNVSNPLKGIPAIIRSKEGLPRQSSLLQPAGRAHQAENCFLTYLFQSGDNHKRSLGTSRVHWSYRSRSLYVPWSVKGEWTYQALTASLSISGFIQSKPPSTATCTVKVLAYRMQLVPECCPDYEVITLRSGPYPRPKNGNAKRINRAGHLCPPLRVVSASN